jgi:hypothetical protein
MSSIDFYRNLPPISLQSGLCNSRHHHTVPDDWSVVIVDIIGSTKAIGEGRYKDVNIASSCAIVAVLNRLGRGQICYIYGGDGATFLIPSSMAFDAASALYGVQAMVRHNLKLDMRAGIVPVTDLRAQGKDVRAAKVEVRPGVYQTSISGSGAPLAERWVKDPSSDNLYLIAAQFDQEKLGLTEPSFEGFECRWNPVRSRNGVDVCLLAVARGESEQENTALYQSLMEKIVEICGFEDHWRPVSETQLSVSISPAPLEREARVRTAGKSWLEKIKYWVHITAMTWTGWICMRYGTKAGSFDGATYAKETSDNTDYIKFENALKIVMDVTMEQKDALGTALETFYLDGKFYYGLHMMPSAMITCLVFDYDGDHYHFIDGSDGGYTLAAVGLKAQMKPASPERF